MLARKAFQDLQGFQVYKEIVEVRVFLGIQVRVVTLDRLDLKDLLALTDLQDNRVLLDLRDFLDLSERVDNQDL